MSGASRLPLRASFIRADACVGACAMIVLMDGDERVAHIAPENVELLIGQLRAAAAVAAARRGPVS